MLTNIRERFKNRHFLALISSVFMSASGLLIFVLLLRSMKINEMGYWIFFQTAFTLFDTFRAGFLQTALIKFYSGATKKRAAEVLGSVWLLATLITSGWFILTLPALFFIHYIGDNSIKIVIEWAPIIFLITLPTTISTWRLQSDQKFDKLLYLGMISQGILIFLILGLIFMDKMDIENLLYANGVMCLITSCVCLFSGWSGLKYFRMFSKSCSKELYNFGKFSVGTSISSNLLRSSDVFMINFLLGAIYVPIYNVAQRLMEVVEIPLRSLLVTGMPELSAAFNQNRKKDLVDIMEKYSGMLTLVLVPAAVLAVLLADIPVAIIGGGKYLGTEAANIFRIFMVLSILYPIDRFTGVTLDIIHQPKRNFFKVLLMLVVNVIGNYVGVQIFGNLYGIVFSTVLSFAAGMLYGYTSLKEFLSFNLKEIIVTGFQGLKVLSSNVFKKRIEG